MSCGKEQLDQMGNIIQRHVQEERISAFADALGIKPHMVELDGWGNPVFKQSEVQGSERVIDPSVPGCY